MSKATIIDDISRKIDLIKQSQRQDVLELIYNLCDKQSKKSQFYSKPGGTMVKHTALSLANWKKIQELVNAQTHKNKSQLDSIRT